MSRDLLQLETIFAQAIEIAAPEDRARFLDQACGDDAELRREVEKLVSDHFRAGGFMERPAVQLVATMEEPLTERPGTLIGPYKLLEQIGEGGFGVVFMAEQTAPVKRKVALKVIKPGMDTRQVIARFEAERQALALMDHPNIARVLDAGATEAGRPFFVMELVKGVPITDYCDQNQLPPRERLELFVTVCQAVQHAHQKGIIHRDIKPTNVLVTLHDDRPVVKVIDFGVAKATSGQLTDKTLFTGFAQMIGTPLYMSPEQAALSAIDVDTRSDIYSLGVLLYELLTGLTPFDKARLHQAAFDEIRRIIREEEPQKPSTRLSDLGRQATRTTAADSTRSMPATASLASIAALRHSEPRKLSQLLRGELDWIVMKALEKDRSRRYATANGLAADVLHYLADEPVSACPPSLAYRARKFARRNKTATALVTMSLVALLATVGVAVGVFYNARLRIEIREKQAQREKADQQTRLAERQRRRAEEESRRAAQQEAIARALRYGAQVNLAHRAWQDNHVDLMLSFLEQERPQNSDEVDLRSFEWHYLWRLCHSNRTTLTGHAGRVARVCYSPDGKQLASAGNDKTVRIWDVATGRALHTLTGHSHFVVGLAYSPNGRWIASGSYDKTVRIWDAHTGLALHTLSGHPGEVRGLAFSQDGSRLVSVDYSGFVRIWDAATWREIQMFRPAPVAVIRGVDFSPDATRLVLAYQDVFSIGALRILDAASGEVLQSIQAPGPVFDVAFSPDGKSIVSSQADGSLRFWDATTLDLMRTIPAHDFVVFSFEFSKDGKRLVSASWDQTIKVWDVASGALVARLKGHAGYVYDAALRPDGEQIASCGWDQTVRLWDVSSSPENQTLAIHDGPVTSVSFSPDGRQLASASHDGSIKITDVGTGRVTRELRKHAGAVNSVSFSPEGRYLASAGADHTVRIWETGSGDELHTLQGYAAPGKFVAFSPDGTRVAAAFGDWDISTAGGIKVWNATTGQEVLTLKGFLHYVRGLAFSPDGGRLAAVSHQAPTPLDGRLAVWDAVVGGEPLISRDVPDQQTIFSVLYSRDGQQIYTGGYDNSVIAWDAKSGDRLFTLKGHSAGVLAMATTPDGHRLVSASGDVYNSGAYAEVIVWNLATRQQVLTLKGHEDAILAVAISPDGRLLATASRDGLVKIWDAREPSDSDRTRR